MLIDQRHFFIWARQFGKRETKYNQMVWVFSYMLEHPEDFSIQINNKKMLTECLDKLLTHLDQTQIIEPLK